MSNQFKFNRIFDSNTVRGRANVSVNIRPDYNDIISKYSLTNPNQVAKATWASVGLIYVLVKMRRRNAKRREAIKYCKGCQQKLFQ